MVWCLILVLSRVLEVQFREFEQEKFGEKNLRKLVAWTKHCLGSPTTSLKSSKLDYRLFSEIPDHCDQLYEDWTNRPQTKNRKGEFQAKNKTNHQSKPLLPLGSRSKTSTRENVNHGNTEESLDSKKGICWDGKGVEARGKEEWERGGGQFNKGYEVWDWEGWSSRGLNWRMTGKSNCQVTKYFRLNVESCKDPSNQDEKRVRSYLIRTGRWQLFAGLGTCDFEIQAGKPANDVLTAVKNQSFSQ